MFAREPILLANTQHLLLYCQQEGVDPTPFRFWVLLWILNIKSSESRLAECSVRFTYIQHRAVLSLRVVCDRLYFQGGNCEFDKTIWLVQPQKKSIWKWSQLSQQLWLATRVRIAHTPVHNLGQCRLSWWVCCLPWSIVLWTFWHVVLRFYGSQTVSVVMALQRQESCIISWDCEKQLHNPRICLDLKKLKGFCYAKQ